MAIAFALIALPSISFAEDANPLSFNVSLTTDYRYRGISQTRLKPALQGGVDYAFPNGFYIGAWASTIKSIKDFGGDASFELDLYGGYKGEIQKGFGYDVGLLQYVYTGASTPSWDAGFTNPNTTEIYGALTYGPVTGKLSYALSNLFGNYNFGTNQKSSGSYYFDLSAGFDTGFWGLTLAPHVGYQKVEHIDNASYTDYSLTLSKDLGSGVTVSAALVGTDTSSPAATKAFYTSLPTADNKFLGKTGGVLSVKYSF
jgi:uncharacterized protein (TIGR02001 family)